MNFLNRTSSRRNHFQILKLVTFLFLTYISTLFLLTACHHDPSAASESQKPDTHHQVTHPTSTSSPLPKDLGTLLQEQIWDATSRGESETSIQLKDELIHKIMTDDYQILDGKHLGGTVTKFLIQFASNIRGILKPYDDDAKKEVAAYEMDWLFGFRSVPLTLHFKRDGHDFSFQLFMTTEDKFQSSIHYENQADIQVFDYLIGNHDRHGCNLLYTTEHKRFIAIDHGRSFSNRIDNGGVIIENDTDMRLFTLFDAQLCAHRPESMVQVNRKTVHPEIIKKINISTPTLIYDKLTEYLPNDQIETVQKRVELLIRYFNQTS